MPSERRREFSSDLAMIQTAEPRVAVKAPDAAVLLRAAPCLERVLEVDHAPQRTPAPPTEGHLDFARGRSEAWCREGGGEAQEATVVVIEDLVSGGCRGGWHGRLEGTESGC